MHPVDFEVLHDRPLHLVSITGHEVQNFWSFEEAREPRQYIMDVRYLVVLCTSLVAQLAFGSFLLLNMFARCAPFSWLNTDQFLFYNFDYANTKILVWVFSAEWSRMSAKQFPSSIIRSTSSPAPKSKREVLVKSLMSTYKWMVIHQSINRFTDGSFD